MVGDFLIRSSSDVQLWMIRRPNPVTRFLLTGFYVVDVLTYSAGGAKEFLTKRQELLGDNFAALGKVIVGDHATVVEIIDAPQQRGYFLGRARLIPQRIAPNFLLALSDQEAGGTTLHSVLHENIWSIVVPPAMERIQSNPIFTEYVHQGVQEFQDAGKDKAKLTRAVDDLVIRYVFHAITGTPVDKGSQVLEMLRSLFISTSPIASYVGGALSPIAAPFYFLQGGRRKAIQEMVNIILKSPVMESYAPSEKNGNLPKEDYASLLLSLIGIAGIGGVKNLCIEVLTQVPQDVQIDFQSENYQQEALLVVLEAARRRSPVNNVNVILQNEKTLKINGKDNCTLPVGTVVAASIGLASLDGKVFENPETFNHKRENLVSASLNFNAIGFQPTGSGTRQCPARNIAVHFAVDVLKQKSLLKK